MQNISQIFEGTDFPLRQAKILRGAIVISTREQKQQYMKNRRVRNSTLVTLKFSGSFNDRH